jgi:DNA primase
VATPIAWDELGVDVRFDHFNVGNVRQRMREVADPWAGYFAVRQSVTKAMAARVDVRW